MQKDNFYSSQELVIGNYTLCWTQLLGKGATGCVYKAFHTTTRSPAAVKHIDLATISDDATRILLQNEQKALKMIDNSNVVKLLDIV
jgi:serine/threonine protein kinase